MSAAPAVHAIALAAGRGHRMGGPKHLLLVDGEPMLARVVAALRGSRCAGVAVVLRPGDSAGRECARALGAPVVYAEDPEEGRAASVRAGVGAVPAAAAMLFALVDQPYLEATDFDALVGAFEVGRAGIVHASYGGARGSPVLFAPRYRAELLALRGADGGRTVLAQHPEDVAGVELDPAHGRDVDRPQDLCARR